MQSSIKHIENTISAKTRENAKTQAGRAEDIAYTINHALACTVTDAFEPYLDSWFQEKLGFRFPLGCGHDHSKDHPSPEHKHHAHGHHHAGHVHEHPHHHDHESPEHKHSPAKGNLWRWYAGELIGDFGAVPVTVAMQRYAPSFMHGLRQLMEPLVGFAFKAGAQHSAQLWAKRQGFAANSEECREKQAQIYEHEVSHLPQALLWTASSITLNLCTQKLLGNKGPLWQMGAAKAMGSGLNTLVVVGGRAMMPQTARKWDRFTSRNLFLPATKTIGKLFGVEEAAVDTMAEKSWAERMEREQPLVGKS